MIPLNSDETISEKGIIMRLENKVALITGSGGGIGFETAKRFVEEGATVIISDLKEDVVNQAIDTLSKETNQKVYGYVLDVSKEASVEDTFSNIKHDIGKLDILINCAGITGADKTTDQLTEEEWDQVFAVDVKGVFFCTKQLYHSYVKMVAVQSLTSHLS